MQFATVVVSLARGVGEDRPYEGCCCSKSGIQLKECGNQVPRTKNLKPSTWNPESTAWNPESNTVLDSPTGRDIY